MAEVRSTLYVNKAGPGHWDPRWLTYKQKPNQTKNPTKLRQEDDDFEAGLDDDGGLKPGWAI